MIPPPRDVPADRPSPWGRTGPVAALLALLVAAVYGRTLAFPFVNLDDLQNLVDNPAVRGGLSAESVRWALSTDMDAGRIPVTWLSRLLDVTLFGMDAGGHRAVNLLLHFGAALLLYLALRRASGRPGESALAACLLAVHPQHVESVAWVTDRKDVLCAFFWMAALLAYGRYAERPSARRYGAVFAAFLLSLLSKPMAVTLPFVLLLLDYWPLGRLLPAPGGGAADGGAGKEGAPPFGLLLLEKAPLLLLSLAVSAYTLVEERSAGAMTALGELPLGTRAGNALLSWGTYLAKGAWPSGLAVIYPHRGADLPAVPVAASLLLLAAATAASLLRGRRHRWLPAGWLWYLGTLVPVIGLVQVGEFARADRYAYLPMVGIYVVAAWGGSEGARRLRLPPAAATAAAVAAVAALASAAFVQAGYWRDSETLLRRAVAITPRNPTARNNLGMALLPQGRTEEAEAQFREALREHPAYGDAAHNLGVVSLRRGDAGEAERWFREAVRLDPASAAARSSLGALLARKGRTEEAVALFRQAVAADPEHLPSWTSLGRALVEAGRAGEAAELLRRHLRDAPGHADAWNDLGAILAGEGRLDEGERCFEEALRADPGHEGARGNLERLRAAAS